MPAYSATPETLYHGGEAAARRAAREGRGGRTLAAFAILAAIGLVSASLAERRPFERALPGLGRLYQAVGLPAAPRGAVLEDVTCELTGEAQAPVLQIEGRIVNSLRAEVGLPDLRVSVLASDGHEIYHWMAAPPKTRLKPGETISFQAKLESPPQNAARIAVRFVRPGDDAWMAPPQTPAAAKP